MRCSARIVARFCRYERMPMRIAGTSLRVANHSVAPNESIDAGQYGIYNQTYT